MLIFTKSCKFSRSFQALVQVRQNTTLWPCGMFFCFDQRWGNKKNAQVRQPLHSALREWEKCQLWKLWCFGKTFRLQTISMDWWSMADIVHNVFNISGVISAFSPENQVLRDLSMVVWCPYLQVNLDIWFLHSLLLCVLLPSCWR